MWINVGSTHDETEVNPPPPPVVIASREECEALGDPYRTWDGYRCQDTGSWSPIIVDVARNGYHLTDVSHGVSFDLNNDGAQEVVAWTKDGSDDAFLAIDRNGNGTIDNVRWQVVVGRRPPTKSSRVGWLVQ